MFPIHKIKTLFFILLTASAVLLSNPVYAKVCKGMSNSECSSSASCSWIKGYKTKSGSKVNAYCRNKASKKNNEEKDKNKKSSTKKSDSEKKDKNKKSSTKKSDSKKKDKNKKSSTKKSDSEKKDKKK